MGPSVMRATVARAPRTVSESAPSAASLMRASWARMRFSTGSGGAPKRSVQLDLDVAQLVDGLGQRDAAVDVELGRLVGDVVGRHVGVEREVEPHRAHERAAVAAQLGDGLGEQVAVELEADGGDVPRLLVAEQAAGAAQLEIAQRDAVARAELRVVGQRREARPCLLRELAAVRDTSGRRARRSRHGRRGRGSGTAGPARARRRAR